MTLALTWSLVGWGATPPPLAVPSIAYPTLADAVAAAVPGDRIEVDATYSLTDPQLVVDRALTVAGVNGRPLLTTSDPNGLFLVDGGELLLEDVLFDGQDTDRALDVARGSATVRGCELRSGHAQTDGGLIRVQNTAGNVLSVERSALDGGSAGAYGGLIAVKGGLATVSDASLLGGSAANGGGIAVVAPGTLTVSGSSLSANVATGHGGGIWSGTSLAVTRSRFESNRGILGGGGIQATAGLTLTDSWVEANSTQNTTANGAGVTQTGGTGRYERVVFCLNESASLAGGLYVNGGDATGTQLVFASNGSGTGAGGIRVDMPPEALPAHAFDHVTLVENEGASYGQGLSVASTVTLTDSFVAAHTTGASAALFAASPGGLTVTSTLFENNAADVSANVDASDPSNVLGSVGAYTGIVPAGCDLAALEPPTGSALIGAASDGTSLGAWIGPGEWPDVDGDGALFLDDCDDADPAVRPGAAEAPADGVDQDCDGAELCYGDADDDGFGDPDPIDSADLDCTDPGESATADDACPGFDDALDHDRDQIPDGCDACPDDAFPNDDTDGDDVCNSADVCEGFNDAIDTDDDGTPNGCDTCSSPDDSDGDGVLDDCDLCPDHDDHADCDGDGAPDGCDFCADDPPPDDDDQDGACDSVDRCPGFDDDEDQDLDHIPDGCDGCPDAIGDDSDGDGVCDPEDPCPLDNPDDVDGDGLCSSADPCPADPNPACVPTMRDGPRPGRVIGCGCDQEGFVAGPLGLALALALARRHPKRRAR